MTARVSRRRDRVYPLVALSLLAAACASASAVRLGEATYPPRAQDAPVVVFEREVDLPRPFVRIGRVVGEGSDLASFAEVVDQMKVQVRELGGDALLLDGSRLLLDANCDGGFDIDRTVHALAVRWR